MSSVPKAVLYYTPTSVWSAVVLLTLYANQYRTDALMSDIGLTCNREEKGYGDDEIALKPVDLAKGENLDPAYLRINPQGTVPTLVVPLDKTLSSEIETRYKAVTSTKAIVELLDKSRSTRSHTHTTSSAPAPTLTPATISFANLSNFIIDELLHESTGDPNRLMAFGLRDEESLKKQGPIHHAIIKGRYDTACRWLERSVGGEVAVTEKIKALWAQKKVEVAGLIEVLGKAEIPSAELNEEDAANRQNYLAASKEAWEVGLKEVLIRLEKEVMGPFVLGEQISLADLHLVGWLARLLSVIGVVEEEDGETAVNKLNKTVGLGEVKDSKLAIFWDSVKERKSFKKVYGKGLY